MANPSVIPSSLPAPASNASNTWHCDGPISLPQPPPSPVLVDFGGFAFTASGMAHNISASDYEDLMANVQLPEGAQ